MPKKNAPENLSFTATSLAFVVVFVFSITTREADRQGKKCVLTSFFSTQESILHSVAVLTWECIQILHENMLKGECIDDYSL